MKPDRLDTIIPPLRFRHDNALVTIYEVTKTKLINGQSIYNVNLDITYKKKKSQRFTLFVKDWDDLLKKLLVEIPKFKLMVLMGYEK